MELSDRHRRLMELFGVSKKQEQSDEDFVRWLENLRRHRYLMLGAKSIGTPITSDMTMQDIWQAYLKRQREALEERGIVPGAHVVLYADSALPKEVTVLEIVEKRGMGPHIEVKYWSITWDRPDNRGRTNSSWGQTFMHHGKVKNVDDS